MLWGNMKETTKLFDSFEESDEKYMNLIPSITVKIDSKRFSMDLIVTKHRTGYDHVQIKNSNITVTDLKKLANSRTIEIDLRAIKEILSQPISYIPNISLPLYKFLLIIADIIEQSDIKIYEGERYEYNIVSNGNSTNVINLKSIFYNEYEEKNITSEGILVLLNKPICLRAQNSKNRSGFGWEWDETGLVEEGRFYGETTEYPIVGCIIGNYQLWEDEDIEYKIEAELIKFKSKELVENEKDCLSN